LVLGLGLATAAFLRERAARQRERTQSVRADTVTTFIDSLVSDQLPSLLQQGNVRGARELISKAGCPGFVLPVQHAGGGA
jgi:hypothetical protein